MKKIIQFKLKILAKLILKKYKPKIVGITGSVGKTSTKEAVYQILSSKIFVGRTKKSLNTEFGMPLTIIGADNPGKNIIGWIKVFLKALRLLIIKNKYPEILILEMGADKPGDIEYLLKIAPLDVGILTAVAPAHLAEFKTVEAVLKEKSKILFDLKEGGRAIINNDEPLISELKDRIKTNYSSVGFAENSDFKILESDAYGFTDWWPKSQGELDQHDWGVTFKVLHDGSAVPFFLPHQIGNQGVRSATYAIACGIHFGLNKIEIAQALKGLEKVPGRMSLLSGLKETLIIDESYNSSPIAVKAALDELRNIPIIANRRIAVLGNMNELGAKSDELHQEIGYYVATSGLDLLLTFGEGPLIIHNAAVAQGMNSENCYHFTIREKLEDFLQEIIQPRDLILIKGSQNNVRLEKTVKAIMQDPFRAEELLVRQGREWN